MIEVTVPSPTAADVHRSPLLCGAPGVVHGITKRVRGLGLADGNVGYGPPRDRDDAWEMRGQWLAAAELEADQIVTAHQVHGAGVAIVGARDAGRGAAPGSGIFGQADALVTNEPGVVLLTLHADCMPILICDPVRMVVATIHAGWRGTVADVAGATVRAMHTSFGSVASDLLVYLGPAIGGCCYEVGSDVAEAWTTAGAERSRALSPTGERWTFDLDRANRILLQRAGVPCDRIESSGICTRCNGETWFSHRGQGERTGRYGSFIAIVS